LHGLLPGARRALVRRLRDEAPAVYREPRSRTPHRRPVYGRPPILPAGPV